MDDLILRLKREAEREPHEPIWRDAINELIALRCALFSIILDADKSPAECREIARTALPNASLQPAARSADRLEGVVGQDEG